MASDNIKRHVSHIKSMSLNGTTPVLPSSSDIMYGEIAVNYANGYETISIKNSSNNVVRFSGDQYFKKQYIDNLDYSLNKDDNKVVVSIGQTDGLVSAQSTAITEVKLGGYSKSSQTGSIGSTDTISTALSKLENNLVNTINDLDSTKSGSSTHVTVGVAEVDGKITSVTVSESNITDYNTFTAHASNTNLHFTGSEKANLDSLATNISTISGINSTNVSNWNTAYNNNHTHSNKGVLDGISSTNVSNWNTAYNNNHTHSNKAYLDNIGGYLGSMAYQNTSSYSSATEVNSALGEYLPLTGGTLTGALNVSGGSNAGIKVYGDSDDGYGRIYVDSDGLNLSANNTSAKYLFLNSPTYVNSTLEVDGGNLRCSDYISAGDGFKKSGSSNDYVLLGGGGHSKLKTINGNSIFGNGDITISVPDGVPLGSIVIWAYSSIPSKWHICDGTILSGSEYSDFINEFGPTLPNLQGRFVVGVNSSDSDFVFGAYGGEKTHTLTVDEMPSHNHEFLDYYFSEAWGSYGSGYVGAADSDDDNKLYGVKHNTENRGSGMSHNNLPPFRALYYIIKVKK